MSQIAQNVESCQFASGPKNVTIISCGKLPTVVISNLILINVLQVKNIA